MYELDLSGSTFS